MKNKDAFDLFLTKERKELQGRKSRNLVILSLIFLVALLSIGFGSASLRYLGYKMEDRFVACVDITVDQIYSQGYDRLNVYVSDEAIQKQFGIDSTEQVWQFWGRFDAVDDGSHPQLDGRSCSANSPILKECILSEENVVKKSSNSLKDDDFSIIISLEGLKKLGYENDMPRMINQYVYGTQDNIPRTIGVPIYAIVKELPDMCDFMATEAWYKQDISGNCDHFDVSLDKYNKYLKLCVSDSLVDLVQSKLEKSGFEIRKKSFEGAWCSDYTCLLLSYYGSNRTMVLDSVYASYKAMGNIFRVYDFESDSLSLTRDPQLYSCFFNRDSIQYHVEQFRQHLKDETGYNLDMAKINSLKNLAYVQAMGSTLSICIILISIITSVS